MEKTVSITKQIIWLYIKIQKRKRLNSNVVQSQNAVVANVANEINGQCKKYENNIEG